MSTNFLCYLARIALRKKDRKPVKFDAVDLLKAAISLTGEAWTLERLDAEIKSFLNSDDHFNILFNTILLDYFIEEGSTAQSLDESMGDSEDESNLTTEKIMKALYLKVNPQLSDSMLERINELDDEKKVEDIIAMLSDVPLNDERSGIMPDPDYVVVSEEKDQQLTSEEPAPEELY